MPFEELADDVSRLANGGVIQQAINRILQRAQWSPLNTGETQVWALQGDAGVSLNWSQIAISGGSLSLWFELDVPSGAQLTSVAAYLKGAGAHSALPATMPKLELFKQSDSGSGPIRTTVFSVTDSSANAAAYDAHHVISAVGLTEAIQRNTYLYKLRITGEAGANALSGLSCPLVSVSFLTGTADDRGAA